MDRHNQRGQILIEALIVLLVIAALLFAILSQLQLIQKRTRQYGLSKEIHYQYSAGSKK